MHCVVYEKLIKRVGTEKALVRLSMKKDSMMSAADKIQKYWRRKSKVGWDYLNYSKNCLWNDFRFWAPLMSGLQFDAANGLRFRVVVRFCTVVSL